MSSASGISRPAVLTAVVSSPGVPATVLRLESLLLMPAQPYVDFSTVVLCLCFCWFPSIINFPTVAGIPAVAFHCFFCGIKNHDILILNFWTI